MGSGLQVTRDVSYGLNPVSQWTNDNPNDPKTEIIDSRIASKASNSWVVGRYIAPNNSDVANTQELKNAAIAQDKVMQLTLYAMPALDDGVGNTSPITTEEEYKGWIDLMAGIVSNARCVVTVEPDALWFVDRQTPESDADAYNRRMNCLSYAVDTFKVLPRTRVYVEAGTTSGSVTPERMGDLLKMVGVDNEVGFAVNVASFSPTSEIHAYAQSIRSRLIAHGVSAPRYLVDTSRNENPDWATREPPYEYINPPGRRVGNDPAMPASGTPHQGHDGDLWWKSPGTSDGNGGVGVGSTGGQFLPQVGYDMVV